MTFPFLLLLGNVSWLLLRYASAPTPHVMRTLGGETTVEAPALRRLFVSLRLFPRVVRVPSGQVVLLLIGALASSYRIQLTIPTDPTIVQLDHARDASSVEWQITVLKAIVRRQSTSWTKRNSVRNSIEAEWRAAVLIIFPPEALKRSRLGLDPSSKDLEETPEAERK